jgi:predicted TIM-barrel fold metal-dependent hydrolase
VCSDEDAPESRPGAHAVGLYESKYFGQRALHQLVLSGVFERHPNLQFVLTEIGGAAWVLQELSSLDNLVRGASVEHTIRNYLIGEGVGQLSLLPSEYYRRQCHISTGFHRDDIPKRHEIGVDRILWGADFPHHEGTAGYTLEWLRASMSGLPEDEVRAITSLNAADVYDIDLEFLQTQADEVGPGVQEVAARLVRDEIPTDPNFLMAFPELFDVVGAPR